MMTTMAAQACVVCGGLEWTRLPDPAPQSMASDWRIVKEPLAKSRCNQCGLVCRLSPLGLSEWLYSTGYELYAHAPGERRERARQREYAAWIAAAVETTPSRILDVGCGNGSLLLALRTYWPLAEMLGCDPSSDSIAWGAAHSLGLWQGTASDLPAGVAADLVVSVNVVEHTLDPLAFLMGLRQALAPHGLVVLVHPDGGRPGLELLIADHVYSFAGAHLEVLLARAGLHAVAAKEAPPTLSDFRMALASRDEKDDGSPARIASDIDAYRTYLTRWQQLDRRLQQRVQPPAVCFGASEAAGLLRAYAPDTWLRVTACTFDGATEGTFGELPVIPLDSVAAEQTILLGVRPADQRRVAARLRARFASVVAWYDLVDDA